MEDTGQLLHRFAFPERHIYSGHAARSHTEYHRVCGGHSVPALLPVSAFPVDDD